MCAEGWVLYRKETPRRLADAIFCGFVGEEFEELRT
jgi:hypothetical protein